MTETLVGNRDGSGVGPGVGLGVGLTETIGACVGPGVGLGVGPGVGLCVPPACQLQPMRSRLAATVVANLISCVAHTLSPDLTGGKHDRVCVSALLNLLAWVVVRPRLAPGANRRMRAVLVPGSGRGDGDTVNVKGS